MAEARVGVRKTYKLFVGGDFVRSESGRSYRVARGEEEINAPRASRKDLRDAVRAARGAFAGWSGRTAMNRGQVLYRAAEMLDGRRAEFVDVLGGGRGARREVDAAVEAWVWYAGLTDKLHQLAGTVNPVAGPYFNFTLPEPAGVVGTVAPEEPSLLPLVHAIAAALCGGNTVVALASRSRPLPALTLGEVLATSDVPAGAVNILTGERAELQPWLGSHMDVNAIDASGCAPDELARLQELGAGNLKRVVTATARLTPSRALGVMEFKTVWHPIGR